MTDPLLNTRRAKNLRLPTASSRQYVASGSAFPSCHHLLPRRSARAIESDADDSPEKPLTSTSSHPRTSLITRPRDNEGGKLWMALKEVSLSRQAKSS